MKSLLAWHMLSRDDWNRALWAALAHGEAGRTSTNAAAGKGICLMFFNSSLRTRASMEVAAAQLGAHVTSVTPGSGVWSMAFEDGVAMDGPEAEHVREAAGVLSRYYDAIGVRLFASLSDREQDRSDRLIHQFAAAATVPVINLESASWHPCQELADAATIQHHLHGRTKGKKLVLAWSHHPKALPTAVPNSALMMAVRLGMAVTVARPDGYALDPAVMKMAHEEAQASGGSIEESSEHLASFDGADVVYSKAWAGSAVYDNTDAEASRRNALKSWKVTADAMARTNGAAFMHCLPIRRNVVADDDVLDGPSAIHLLQAEFRLHAQKAILEMIWGLDS